MTELSRPHFCIAGKITLPSTILQFWDLGGQRGIRNIWHRYYDDCHAVVYVIDAEDRERFGEGWEVFGMSAHPEFPYYCIYYTSD